MLFSNFEAQIQFDKTKHDFGNIMPYENRFVDITLKNTSPKKEYILRVVKEKEVVYISTGAFIEPNADYVLRFQVNPNQKGKFSYDIEIFLSDRDEAVKIKLSGNLLENPTNDLAVFTSCPDFSQQKAGADLSNFKLTVVVIDKITKEVLPNSNVSLIQNGNPILSQKTDRNGKVEKTVPLGFTYFYANNSAYKPTELGAYVNFKRNYIVLELEKNPVTIPVIPVDVDTLIADVPPEIILDEILKEEELLTQHPSLDSLPFDNFDPTFFNPVNIVFILDISSSMTQADKIELMKYALFQLTDMLRPEDKISIVTYANDAKVILNSTSAADKELIKKTVQDIKGGGMTAGGTGIKLGFKEAYQSRISNGPNHVIIITDGAFNRNSEDYKKQIKKYAKKGITMSVVGIKNADRDEEEMRNVATLGKGRYIPIFKLLDAKNNLRQEIRLITLKK